MPKNQHFTYLINKSMNGGFNLTKKQLLRRSPLLNKKLAASMANSKFLPEGALPKPRSGRKCSGGLKGKGSSSKIPKRRPSTNSYNTRKNWDVWLSVG